MWVHPEHRRPNSTSEMRRKENQPRPQDKTDEGKRKVGHYCPWTVPLSQMFENTLEERYGTAVSTCTPARTADAERNQRRHVCQHLAAERCKESTRVQYIAINIDALVISVPVQLLHGGCQILFDAVQWPWFPGIMMHVRAVQHVRQPRF